MSSFEPTEIQLDVVEQGRKLADRFSLDYWHEKDEAGEYPWEFVKAFAEAGGMGIITPEEYGGLGLGVTEAALLLREIAPGVDLQRDVLDQMGFAPLVPTTPKRMDRELFRQPGA